MKNLPVEQGLLFHLLQTVRPNLADRIKKKQKVETLVVGLGTHGLMHAGLMQNYGTEVTAGVSKIKQGQRILGTVPVYGSVRECVQNHPDIAVASIWRNYASAPASAMEAIECGIPLVVVISEGIPLRDARDLVAAARRSHTLLVGPNTPGILFPPESIKIGMLPDIFQAEETPSGQPGAHGVTILSRSGAVLYHISDALAGAGVAQNAVIGVGGDGAIGSPFRVLARHIMNYPKTDLLLIAGEIGGMQEELLARDIQQYPQYYPKPVVALISGAHAPKGVQMGHAGAIVTPGLEYGTFATKQKALVEAGVTVVNSQSDLIAAVRRLVGKKTYFNVPDYRSRMRAKWEVPGEKPKWNTRITKVAPNLLLVAGYPLAELIHSVTMPKVLHLLALGELPKEEALVLSRRQITQAIQTDFPDIGDIAGEDVSMKVAKYLLTDQVVWEVSQNATSVEVMMVTVARAVGYAGRILNNNIPQKKIENDEDFTAFLAQALFGAQDPLLGRLAESIIVACVDHGVTPPSAQAGRIAASVRSSYQAALAAGILSISDVHGGAGARAAEFFAKCRQDTASAVFADYRDRGKRVEGLGHRIHSQDPRTQALRNMAEICGFAAQSVGLTQELSEIAFAAIGAKLPVNVDGMVGAIINDIGAPPVIAKILFILGRIAGLSAHYYEEIDTQAPMRIIDFAAATYGGEDSRSIAREK